MCLYLFTLAVEVDEGVAGRRNVLRCHALVHAIDIEVETTVGIHQQTQHRPLRTRVQIRTIVLTYLGEKNRKKRERKASGKGVKQKREEISHTAGGNTLSLSCETEISSNSVTNDRFCVFTFRELWKTESLCSSQAERFRQHAVDGKLSRSGEWPITPNDSDDVHDGFRRSI